MIVTIVRILSLSLVIAAGVFGAGLAAAEQGGAQAPWSPVHGKAIGVQLAEVLGEWGAEGPENGSYCCACIPKEAFVKFLQLNDLGDAVEICQACDNACVKAGYEGAEGFRSKPGKCQ
jgi:hypothetical protein